MLYRTLLPVLLFYQVACGTSPAHDVENAAWGVAFDVPEGWSAALDGKVYRVTHGNDNELMLVYRNAYSAKAALIETYHNWTQGDLLPVTEAFDDHGEFAIGYPLAGTYDQVAVTGYAVDVANPAGKGLSVMILVSNGEVQEQHAQLAVQVANTVRFSTPDRSASAAEEGEWVRKLEGKRLQFYLGTGSPTRQTIQLFRDRRCTYSWYSPGAETGDQQHENEGQWTITAGDDGAPRLVLDFTDGTQRSFRVSEADGGFQLNTRVHQWEPLDE